MHVGVEVYLYAFLIAILDRGESSSHVDFEII
jgi:hypothetical protein